VSATASSRGRAAAVQGQPARIAAPAEDAFSPEDAFPHTRRPLPWLLAAFLAALFFVPLDSTSLKVSLPFDSTIDRALVIVLVLAWMWFGGDERTLIGRRRSKLVLLTTFLFVAIAATSVIADSHRLINLGELSLSEKKLALLCTYVTLSWFAMTALRPEDLRGICRYLVWLAALMSVGVIIERHTGYNVFYSVSRTVLSPIATVGPTPTDIHPTGGTRVAVVGPTVQGLALTTMLVMVMPFAIVAALDARNRKVRFWNAVAFCLMAGAAVATAEKTSIVAPVFVLAFLCFHRPRRMVKLLLPLSVVLIAVIHVAAPGSLGSILDVSAGVGSSSTTSRTNSFGSALPDIMAHPVIGRGFGSLDPTQPEEFRYLDDEYLGELISVGAVGLAAYLLMLIAPILVAGKAIRSRDPARASPALCAAAGCVAYVVVNALFDAQSFVQAPYMFGVMAAICVVTSSTPIEAAVVQAMEARTGSEALARAVAA
jgi:polysaccharide biosynthesis protein PslJ